MKTLHLTLNRKWFDMIASGEKKEEYREIKPFWVSRLLNPFYFGMPSMEDLLNELNCAYDPNGYETVFDAVVKDFNIVSANNGYQKGCPNIKWKHEGIRIGEGREEWGAEPGKQYFILEIGEIIKTNGKERMQEV